MSKSFNKIISALGQMKQLRIMPALYTVGTVSRDVYLLFSRVSFKMHNLKREIELQHCFFS